MLWRFENPNIIQKKNVIDHFYNLLTGIFEWILVASYHFFPPMIQSIFLREESV